jgi:hypothetical protein
LIFFVVICLYNVLSLILFTLLYHRTVELISLLKAKHCTSWLTSPYPPFLLSHFENHPNYISKFIICFWSHYQTKGIYCFMVAMLSFSAVLYFTRLSCTSFGFSRIYLYRIGSAQWQSVIWYTQFSIMKDNLSFLLGADIHL